MTRRLGAGLRALCALAPALGLVPRPEPRPQGITAVVRVRGEEPWLAPCLRSIEDFADEIVVLDNDAAPATRAALDATGSLGGRIAVERCQGLDFLRLSNRGLERARFRWVIRWDADMVAHTSGPGDIRLLREHLLGLDRKRYDLVHVAAVEVAGDLRHQLPALRVRHDGQAVTWAPALRYTMIHRTVAPGALEPHDRILRGPGPVVRALEALRVPRYYRISRWARPAYFHVNVKPARHMLLRHFWLDWLEALGRGAPASQEAYVAERVTAEWGVRDLAAAERLYAERYRELLVPFDPVTCGPYPDLLRPYLDVAVADARTPQ